MAYNPREYNVRILTKTIGDELVRLITSTAPAGSFVVCQFGGVERVAEIDKIGKLLPAVFIEPEGEVEYTPDGKIDISGTHCEVIEHFRVSVWKPYSNTDNPLEVIDAFAFQVLQALRLNPRLTEIAASIYPNMISDGRLVGVDWTPDEQFLLIETAAAVKVIVMRWQVRWYSRG
jgi:hypothetical protein